jgi:hypothetical protein
MLLPLIIFGIILFISWHYSIWSIPFSPHGTSLEWARYPDGLHPRFITTGAFWIFFACFSGLVFYGWLTNYLRHRRTILLSLQVASELLQRGNGQSCSVLFSRSWEVLLGRYFYSTEYVLPARKKGQPPRECYTFLLPPGKWEKREFRERCQVLSGRYGITVFVTSRRTYISDDGLEAYLDLAAGEEYRSRHASRLGIAPPLTPYLPYPWRKGKGVALLAFAYTLAVILFGIVIDIRTLTTYYFIMLLILALCLARLMSCRDDLIRVPGQLRQLSRLLHTQQPVQMHAEFSAEKATDGTPIWQTRLRMSPDTQDACEAFYLLPAEGIMPPLPNESPVTVYRGVMEEPVILIETPQGVRIGCDSAKFVTFEGLKRLGGVSPTFCDVIAASGITSETIGIGALFAPAHLENEELRGHHRWWLTYRFTDKNGQSHVASDFQTTRPSGGFHEKVFACYMPEKPENAVIFPPDFSWRIPGYIDDSGEFQPVDRRLAFTDSYAFEDMGS